MRDFYEFKRTAIEEGQTGRVRRFVILPGRDPGRAAELVENLLRAGIEVRQATAPFRSTRAHDYSGKDSPAASRDFPAGAYVVDLAQPQKRIAKALLEVHTPQDDAFQREQLARFARNERRGARRAEGGVRLLRHHLMVAAPRLRRRGFLDGGRRGRAGACGRVDGTGKPVRERGSSEPGGRPLKAYSRRPRFELWRRLRARADRLRHPLREERRGLSCLSVCCARASSSRSRRRP